MQSAVPSRVYATADSPLQGVLHKAAELAGTQAALAADLLDWNTRLHAPLLLALTLLALFLSFARDTSAGP